MILLQQSSAVKGSKCQTGLPAVWSYCSLATFGALGNVKYDRGGEAENVKMFNSKTAADCLISFVLLKEEVMQHGEKHHCPNCLKHRPRDYKVS